MKMVRSLLVGAALILLAGCQYAHAQVVSRYQPVSTAVASSDIACVQACSMTGLNVTTGASAGWVLVYDAATVPADGATTPMKWFQVAANTSINPTWPNPLRLHTGLVVVFSTTGPFTKTASATAVFSVDIQ